ncbi:MAG: hypothetical protein HWN66_07495 [Candidatus Helarchaeota archaeon]|nr:hypothetical protein [Candidatus Helarchaeota archaeon]
MERRNPWEKTSPYSLIIDLEGKTTPLGVTMTLDLGTVINRMDKELICIGSGEVLGGKQTFKIEEIRALIVRRGDLKTVRSIFENWVQPKNPLEDGKEMAIQGVLGTKDEATPIVRTENGDTLISVIHDDTVIPVRFIKDAFAHIVGVNLEQEATLRGTEVYIYGLALLTEDQNWEIQGRALLPRKE